MVKKKEKKKRKPQTGKKTEPVASDRLLRKCLFILCSGWFISVRAMDLIQEFINKLQMQSLFVFWHQRGPRKWIGVWTNWHHSHERSGTKFSDTEVMSSIGSSPATFGFYLKAIQFLLFIYFFLLHCHSRDGWVYILSYKSMHIHIWIK